MSPRAMLILYICIIGILLILSAFFSCADMTYSVAPVKRLEKKGTKSALLAAELAKDYDKTIIAILFGNNLVNILASSLLAAMTRLDLPLFRSNPEAAAMLAELFLLLFILIFGEILPKVIGKSYSYRLSMAFAKPIKVIHFVFLPIAITVRYVTRAMTKPLFKRVDTGGALPSNEELQAMVDTIEEEGIIDEGQSEMLASAIEFKDICAYEIMTPRVKIEGFEASDNLVRLVMTGRFRHSRIIAYSKNLDNVLGYLPLKEVQRALLRKEKVELSDWLIPILSVPRTMEISLILKAMKQSHHHIVLVKDEYGGNDGILTMEDILEEIVGEMFDESEPVREEVERTEKRNVFRVKGSMHIEDFFDYFHIDEEELEDDVETLSGWLNDRLGRFAREGDIVTIGKVDIVVDRVTPYITEEALVYYHPRRKIAD
ncbi:MAG: HlyC/CorC family transporter [Bacilli bacterium]|nr:HlyC/CorC family transporter [Bacilli bacterium]